MKNKLKNILFVLIIALSMPLTMLLSGCGATASGTVTGVVFDSLDYEDDGTPVFWVDKGVKTSLDYKVYPSSASGYKVYFDPAGTGTPENSLRYNFDSGKITIKDDKFEDVRYKVRIGNYSDTCIVKLKEYPKEIYATETDVVLNSGDIQDIVLKGNFLSAHNVLTKDVILNDNEYNFLVESADETVVSIPNKNRLKFIAARQNGTASTTVNVTMLNCSGEKKDLKVQIKVTVVQNISVCKIIMSGCDEFVENNDDVEINYNDLNTTQIDDDIYGIVNMDFYPINTNNQLSLETNYTISLNKETSFAILSSDGKLLLIRSDFKDGFNLKVKIYFPNLNIKDESGSTSSFTMAISLTFVKQN